jgi:hypothetical protein
MSNIIKNDFRIDRKFFELWDSTQVREPYSVEEIEECEKRLIE